MLVDAVDHKVKSLVVKPGKRLSYQTHAKRSEHWFIVRGHGAVTLDGCVLRLKSAPQLMTSDGTKHARAMQLHTTETRATSPIS